MSTMESYVCKIFTLSPFNQFQSKIYAIIDTNRSMGNEMRELYPCGLNRGFGMKFPEGYIE